jgi:hypothetical protein
MHHKVHMCAMDVESCGLTHRFKCSFDDGMVDDNACSHHRHGTKGTCVCVVFVCDLLMT